jgi:two-component system, NtrC family, sensor kinase
MKIFYSFIVFLFLITGKLFSQDTVIKVFNIDSLPAQGVLLDKGWKFHAGDSPDWAKPNFDDSKWEDIDPTFELYYLPQIRKGSIGWFRIELNIDSSLLNIPLAFHIYQSIASEIYLNGRLVQRYGTVSSIRQEVKSFQPVNEPVGLQFKESGQVLAVRFSVQENLPYFKIAVPYSVFQFRINDVQGAGRVGRIGNKFPVLNAIYTGLFIVLTIIHLGLFLTYKKQKVNLFFSIATLSGAIANGLFIIIHYSQNIALRTYVALFDWIFLLTLTNLFLFIAIYSLFSRIRNIYFLSIVAYSVISILLWGIGYKQGEFLAFMLPFAVTMFESLRIAWNAYRKGLRDAGIIVFGIAWYLILYSIFILFYEGLVAKVNIGFGGKFTLSDAVYQLAVLGVPVALSLYLSRDFAFTSKELENKLSEVQQLSAEKQQILISQNEMLEQQVGERTIALTKSLQELKATQSQLIQSEKMASLGELTAGIAHEIQNPLNFVNNFSEVNKELIGELKEEIKKGNIEEVNLIADDIEANEQKINHHGKRADAIVKGMLQHSRSSSGVKEPTDINALADEYLRLAYHGIRAKDNSFNATLKTDYDESIGNINIIPQDIGRVILNLITNAFYAVAEKKKVQPHYEPIVTISTIGTLSFGEGRGEVKIMVKDNGGGIPQKILDKIFQPFFTTKPTGQGTGLGLSLAYDIIKAHGGELKVEMKEGEGSEFIIQLPVV